jgi:hypothetical protein
VRGFRRWSFVFRRSSMASFVFFGSFATFRVSNRPPCTRYQRRIVRAPAQQPAAGTILLCTAVRVLTRDASTLLSSRIGDG